jgi:hypothetical protein
MGDMVLYIRGIYKRRLLAHLKTVIMSVDYKTKTDKTGAHKYSIDHDKVYKTYKACKACKVCKVERHVRFGEPIVDIEPVSEPILDNSELTAVEAPDIVELAVEAPDIVELAVEAPDIVELAVEAPDIISEHGDSSKNADIGKTGSGDYSPSLRDFTIVNGEPSD